MEGERRDHRMVIEVRVCSFSGQQFDLAANYVRSGIRNRMGDRVVVRMAFSHSRTGEFEIENLTNGRVYWSQRDTEHYGSPCVFTGSLDRLCDEIYEDERQHFNALTDRQQRCGVDRRRRKTRLQLEEAREREAADASAA